MFLCFFKKILFIVDDLCMKCKDTEEAELLLSSHVEVRSRFCVCGAFTDTVRLISLFPTALNAALTAVRQRDHRQTHRQTEGEKQREKQAGRQAAEIQTKARLSPVCWRYSRYFDGKHVRYEHGGDQRGSEGC